MAQTRRVEYIGALRPGVMFRDGDNRIVRANYGEPVEVDAATADGLLSQSDNWREPKPGPKPKTAAEDGGN